MQTACMSVRDRWIANTKVGRCCDHTAATLGTQRADGTSCASPPIEHPLLAVCHHRPNHGGEGTAH